MNKIKCSFCGFANSSIEKNCTMCEVSLLNSSRNSSSNFYTNSNIQTQAKTKISWGTVIFGLAATVFSFYLYSMFDDFEKSGGSIRMPVIVILIYKIGGKWLASIFIGLMGLLTMVGGFIGNGFDDREN